MSDQAQELRELMEVNEPANKAENSDDNKTRIITVTSGKGGVGKTNLAINFALAYASLGKKVIILDADLGMANVNVILGVIPQFNLYHLLKNKKKIEDIIYKSEYGIEIVAGASGFSRIANLTPEERNGFIEQLQELSRADIIIIDTGAGISHNVIDFVAAADDAIIVTTPEPTAITDAYGIIKIIATEISRNNLGLKLVVNRVQSVTQGKRVSERIINIAGQFLNLKLDYLGFVYEDAVVPGSVQKQQPFFISHPNSKASMSIKHIISRLEKVEFKEGSGIGGFLKRFFSSDE